MKNRVAGVGLAEAVGICRGIANSRSHKEATTHGREVTRRTLLLLAAALLVMPYHSGCATTGSVNLLGAAPARAKNIILLIGDGMGPSQFGVAWLYSNRVLNKDLRMTEVMQAGRTAYLANDTADATVTESAAAATQIACGVKVPARAPGMGADGKTPCWTILEIAKERGMATGLVTTSGITDATPASFSAHVSDRSDEASVAAQELAVGVDILMGGRKNFFLPQAAEGSRKDGRNLLKEAQKAGYTVVGTAEELQKAPAGKILGLFNMGNMAFEIDRASTKEPSLAAMTTKTLDVLSRNPKGFFAMIEGGRIDHASHRNDAAGTIQDMLAFDQAVGVALDFAKQHPDTLLLVTADHETGAMSLIGPSKTSKEYTGIDLEAVRKVKASHELIAAKLGKSPTPQKVKAVVKEYMDIEITDDEAKMVASDTIRGLDPTDHNYAYPPSLGFVLRSYLGVGWGSQTHTASPVMAFGLGPGSEKIAGFRHNTELFSIMKTALGN
ncbi:MAG TPA: alkaline phosphatase [Candidatus Methylomirabilis sp.]|nr:alkaline phosphatase [Candidatus Methylomirabilis sp.]